jgi:hypothetical protein
MVSLMAAALLPGLAGHAADVAPAIKPGLWQTTTSVETAGGQEWSDSELAQLPAEERARYQAAMNAALAQSAQPHTFNACVTAEELRGDLTFNFEHNPACRRTVVSLSESSWEIHEVCGGAAQRTATAHFNATGPGEISGETVVTQIKGVRRLVSKAHVHSKWLATDCGSVKPNADVQNPAAK